MAWVMPIARPDFQVGERKSRCTFRPLAYIADVCYNPFPRRDMTVVSRAPNSFQNESQQVKILVAVFH